MVMMSGVVVMVVLMAIMDRQVEERSRHQRFEPSIIVMIHSRQEGLA